MQSMGVLFFLSESAYSLKCHISALSALLY